MTTDRQPQHTSLVSLHGIVNHEMAAHVPPDGTITVPELAKACGMHPDDVAMIIAHGATRRLFLRDEEGRIAHSAATMALTTVPGLATCAESILNEQWKAAPHVIAAMDKWPGHQEIDQTAYNLAHGTALPFFQYLAADGDGRKAQMFADAMTWFTDRPDLSPDFVLAYDWSQHVNGTVVDLGGSHGSIAFKIAEQCPDMKLIVQDRPEIVNTAPHGVHDNVQFQAHDFFKPQSVVADVYFFRWIFHDWPAKYCIRILNALVPALKPGARIVLMETIVPEAGICTPYQERGLMHFSMIMKLLFNAKERSIGDWRELVADADEDGRFKLVDVLRPKGSQLGLLVIEWQGQ